MYKRVVEDENVWNLFMEYTAFVHDQVVNYVWFVLLP